MIPVISKEDIEKIVEIIKEGKLTSTEIVTMFSITRYYLYKIMKEYDIKPSDFRTGPKTLIGSKKFSKEEIEKMLSVVKKGNSTSCEIVTMFGINKYYLYKMMKENNVDPSIFKKGPRKPTGPKKTRFKLLIEGTEEEQKQANIFPPEFVLNDFIADSKKGMKILELMSKYNLTLYQIRELRKKYDLKRR